MFRGKTKEDEFELQCVGGKKSLIIRVNRLDLTKDEIMQKLALVKRLIKEKTLTPKL